MADFKESGFMYALGIMLVVFIIAQSLFFMIKAWRQGKKIGISSATLKKTVTTSVLFTIAPAVSILATVIAIAGALGIVLPWIRLSVIGNIGYETVAATATLESFGGSMASAVTDKTMFSAAAWVMTIGSVFPLILMPLILKKVQAKVGGALNKDARWGDLMSAAAFIGIISAFIARAIAGGAKEGTQFGSGSGPMSVCVLISAVIFMLIFSRLCKIEKLKWLEPFTMPLSMLLGMGVAVLIAQFVPQEIAFLEWR